MATIAEMANDALKYSDACTKEYYEKRRRYRDDEHPEVAFSEGRMHAAQSIQRVLKTGLHLCTYCSKEYPICDGEPEFGDGKGSDNVYRCTGYKEKEWRNE